MTKTTPAPSKKAETPAKKVEKSSSEDSSSDSEEDEPKKTPTDQAKWVILNINYIFLEMNIQNEQIIFSYLPPAMHRWQALETT